MEAMACRSFGTQRRLRRRSDALWLRQHCLTVTDLADEAGQQAQRDQPEDDVDEIDAGPAGAGVPGESTTADEDGR